MWCIAITAALHPNALEFKYIICSYWSVWESILSLRRRLRVCGEVYYLCEGGYCVEHSEYIT